MEEVIDKLLELRDRETEHWPTQQEVADELRVGLVALKRFHRRRGMDWAAVQRSAERKANLPEG
jgi:hypothetical protein